MAKIKSIHFVWILLFFLLSRFNAPAQDKLPIMYFINGELFSNEYVKTNIQANRIKQMNMGISDSLKQELADKYGTQVNDAIIAEIVLYTDEEMKNHTLVSKEEEEDKEEASTLIHVNDMAPDFTVEMLDGTSLKLSDLKGKTVLINFWATWCGPCMMEFEEIPEKILQPFTSDDFVFIPISRGEKREVVEKKMEALQKRGINFNVGLDPDKSIYTRYATTYIPRNFVIDPTGKVVFTSVGYDDQKMTDLVEILQELLGNKKN